MRVAVIGVGGTGSAAARFLAEAGHEVVGFERFRIGHDRGSSHGESRIIRSTYPDSLYARLMEAAYPLWDELERESGEQLCVRCGCLYFGPAGHPDIEAIVRALRDCGRPFEMLDATETRARFPALRLETGHVGIFQTDGGFLRPDACVAASMGLARRFGATIHEETPIEHLTPIPDGRVRVRAAGGGESDFDAAVITAGPWMGKLLARLGLPLAVTRQQLVYVGIARHAADFDPSRLPVWIDAESFDYGFPSDGRIPGVKLSLHRHGERWDPDVPHPPVDEAFIRERVAYAARRLPDLGGEITHSQACLYTNTPDEDFIVDRVPDLPNVWLVSACSGHGFKFTVLLGKISADLATGRECAHDLTRFSLDRFNRA